MGQGASSHFSEYYTTGQTVGIGTFATVKRCIRKSDHAEFAVKIIRKKDLTLHEQSKLKDEIEILRSIEKKNHPHIVRFEEVFESETKVKLVLELCNDKHLLDLIYEANDHRLDEKTSAKIFHDIVETVKYLHDNNIVHRDLKPENILFTKDGTLKLADFGSAYKFKIDTNKKLMKTNIGTPLYVAPEVLANERYSHMVDLWSLGVMLYTMLCGYPPFSSRKSIHRMYSNIMSGTYEFGALWDGIDNEAMDLVSKLLTVDAKKRITCEQILSHPWMQKYVNKC